MSAKLQRKVEKAFADIESNIEFWEKGLMESLSADREIRKSVEKIISYQNILDKTDKHLSLENRIRMEKLSKTFEEISEEIFQNINKGYALDISFKDIMVNNRDKLLSLGIKGILQKEKILEKIYNTLFENSLPLHPKDEHPLARTLLRKFVIHTGPTNSGKTYHSLKELKKRKSGMYLAPLRLLALEVFEKLNIDGIPCSLSTGEEESLIPFASHISSTIEKADLNNYYDLVVIDESQLIGDKSRGNAWTRSILGLYAKEIHICCSLNAVPLLKKLIIDCGDEVEVIEHDRKTPLIMENHKYEFPKDIRKGDAFIVFSRRKVLQIAAILAEKGVKSSLIYGNLPPDTRKKQVQLFLNGETEVIVSTDAIGMGLNLPVRRIIFLETEKFDGTTTRLLKDQEVKQIAGRAGRQGMYSIGLVNSIEPKNIINEKMNTQDQVLINGYISPLMNTILNLQIGSLKDKLKYWNSYESKIPYIQKSNIEDQLTLLDCIPDKVVETLPDEILYRAIYIPFDLSNEKLLTLWKVFLQEIMEKKESFSKPNINLLSQSLNDLETLYKEVDLYYSFSKVFERPFNLDWVTKTREKISDEIHDILKKEYLGLKKECHICGSSIDHDKINTICDDCCLKF